MTARRIGSAVLAAAISLACIPGSAGACGDKLVALGGGVGFERVVVSRNPSHIILLAEPASGLALANDRYNLAGSLRLAGHEVFIVTSAEELSAQRATVRTDLILVDAARAGDTGLQPVSSDSGPIILPVAYAADRADADAAEPQPGCVAIASGRKGSRLLKAVEHALKLRSRGLPAACGKDTDSQRA